MGEVLVILAMALDYGKKTWTLFIELIVVGRLNPPLVEVLSYSWVVLLWIVAMKALGKLLYNVGISYYCKMRLYVKSYMKLYVKFLWNYNVKMF